MLLKHVKEIKQSNPLNVHARIQKVLSEGVQFRQRFFLIFFFFGGGGGELRMPSSAH